MSLDWSSCAHSHRSPIFKIAADGTKRYYLQCDACGFGMVGLKRSDARTKLAVPYREELVELRAREAREAWDAKRRDERAAWFARHDAYLRTPQWKALRQKVIDRERGLCQGCRDRSGTQVHHTSYQRHGRELLIDLVLLCDQCHELAHAEDESGQTGDDLRPTSPKPEE